MDLLSTSGLWAAHYKKKDGAPNLWAGSRTSPSVNGRRRNCVGARLIWPKPKDSVTQAVLAANSLRARCTGLKRPLESLDTTEPPHLQCKRSFNVFIRKIRPGFRSVCTLQPARVRLAIWNIAC